MSQNSGPILDSYWVEPGQLLAGEYPGARSDEQARKKLRLILSAGVTFFLDLTEEGEYNLNPYVPFLKEAPLVLGRLVVHRRMPIRDGKTPAVEEMKRILDTVDIAIEEGHTVYVHCWGGIGRTGAVVGCYMVRHGMSGREALDEIACRRSGTPDGHRRSPENGEQEQMVLSWPVGG